MKKSESDLLEENRMLKASIEIYAKQCNELGKWARIMEKIEGELPELQRNVNALSERVYFVEDTISKIGLFISKRSSEQHDH